MDNHILKLIRVLETLLERHRSLLKLCHEQKQALIDNDIPKLERVIGKMSRLTDEIGQLEGTRKEAALAATKGLGLSPDHLELSSIIQAMSELTSRGRLEQVVAELRQVIKEIQSITLLAGKLTGQSIDYTNRLLGMVSSLVKAQRYGSTPSGSVGGNFINLRT
jgi:flagellar biosynthesis/type III secretory pathway chaperone